MNAFIVHRAHTMKMKTSKHFPDFAEKIKLKNPDCLVLITIRCLHKQQTSKASEATSSRELIAFTAHTYAQNHMHTYYNCIIKNRLKSCDNKWKMFAVCFFRRVFQLAALFLPDNFLNHRMRKKKHGKNKFSHCFVITNAINRFFVLVDKRPELVMSAFDSVGKFSTG